MTPRVTLPDHIDVERLPDDVPVLVTKMRDGHTGAIHLFRECQSVRKTTNLRETTLADPHVERDEICRHCLGEDGAKDGPGGVWEELADPNTTDLPALSGEDDEDQLITDGGRDVGLDVGRDVPRTAADGGHLPSDRDQDHAPGVEVVNHGTDDDRVEEIRDRLDRAADADVDVRERALEDLPECDYGECDETALEVYEVATPSGALRMAACPDDAPAEADPVEVFVRE